MRRTDREITDTNQLEAIIKQCKVCHVAFHDDAYPYLLPLNFGYMRMGDAFMLYFHGAHEGEKHQRMQKDPRVSFAMECNMQLHEAKQGCGFTMAYESIIGHGIMSYVADDGKHSALEAVMRQYVPDTPFTFTPPALSSVTVMQLDVQKMTGKRRIIL